VAAAGLAALATLLSGAPPAWAQSDCSTAFERWAKLSSMRVIPQSDAARGACVPTDAVRSDLLEGLSRVRGVCAESGQGGQTADMLNANLSFIASLAVCPPPPGASSPSNADAGDGWVTKSAPYVDKPKVAAPPPPAPPPAAPTGGPRLLTPAPPPAPPRAVAAVPAPVGPVPGAPSASAPTPPCLEVARAPNDTFALVNHRCRGYTVLAVIETQSGGETACKGYAIAQSLAVRSPAAPPRVNYECILSQGPCNKDRLGDMFPECDW
jgi:hypothetical protein